MIKPSAFWDIFLYVPASICLMTFSLGCGFMAFIYGLYVLSEVSRELYIYLMILIFPLLCFACCYLYFISTYIVLSNLKEIKKRDLLFLTTSILASIGIVVFTLRNEILILGQSKALVTLSAIICCIGALKSIVSLSFTSEVKS